MENKVELKEFFQERGVAEDKAEIMAKQLMKRAEQLAGERNLEMLEAIQYLLDMIVSGQKGEVYQGTLHGRGLEND